jgi:hypothetical protein
VLTCAGKQLANSVLGSDAKRGKDRQQRLARACQHVASKHTGIKALLRLY